MTDTGYSVPACQSAVYADFTDTLIRIPQPRASASDAESQSDDFRFFISSLCFTQRNCATYSNIRLCSIFVRQNL